MGGTGEYQSTAEASNRWRSYPANFIYSGYWWRSVADYRGLGGFYWSRTVHYSAFAWKLGFESEVVNPGGSDGDKRSGHTVRCLSLGS